MKASFINSVTSDVKKVSVSITRRQLWNNFMQCWTDLAWDDYIGVASVIDVAGVLLPVGKINIQKLRKLFRDGHTVFLMGDAMQHFDVQKIEILREIVVDDNGEQHVIRHEDIVF